jgi:hypothetical protein
MRALTESARLRLVRIALARAKPTKYTGAHVGKKFQSRCTPQAKEERHLLQEQSTLLKASQNGSKIP